MSWGPIFWAPRILVSYCILIYTLLGNAAIVLTSGSVPCIFDALFFVIETVNMLSDGCVFPRLSLHKVFNHGMLNLSYSFRCVVNSSIWGYAEDIIGLALLSLSVIWQIIWSTPLSLKIVLYIWIVFCICKLLICFLNSSDF